MNSMATHVDMSLDDIIKSRKKSDRERGQGRGRRRRGRGPSGNATTGGRMTGAVRRGPLSNARPSSHTIAKSFRRTRNFPWQRDLFEDSLRAVGISGIEVGTKLYVSNLHPGVTNDDIRELFSEIGELKRYAIHYDKTGRPSGSAEVVYARRSDSFAALKRYNNVLLDGKPMKIEVVGKNAEVPIQARVNVTGINGRRNRTVVMTSGPGHAGGAAAINRGSGSWGGRGGPRNNQGRGRGTGEGRGRGRGWGRGRGSNSGRGRGGSRGHVQGNKKPVDKSVDELDTELEKYHAEAMQT